MADDLASELERLTLAHQEVSARLVQAQQLIEQLRAENARLQARLPL